MRRHLELRPAGARGVLVEVAGNATARKLAAAAPHSIGGLEDVTCGHDTVLLVWELGRTPPHDLDVRIAELLGSGAGVGSAVLDVPEIELPVTYDGPDLARVGELCGMSPEEVARRHLAADYDVAFIGFTAGFAYLVGGDPQLRPGRLDEPRITVPAGALAIAAEYSAVYPRSCPGGWNLIGRTDAVLFDPDRSPAALLPVGARVRLVEATQ